MRCHPVGATHPVNAHRQVGLAPRSRSGPAAQKAEALIREWLSQAQLHDYEKRKKFRVAGSAGGRYLIAPHYTLALDTGEHISFAPEKSAALPVADVMLACKIALENDEVGVLKVACRWPTAHPPQI